jgi:DNA-binding SARP family transcriptional activator
MSTIEIKLFGTLSIEHNGYAITRFQGKRSKDLLSYLLLNRDANHSRENLAGLFWGHLEDQKARHCLNTALWRLQSVLGADVFQNHRLLCVDAQSIHFNRASDVRLDVAEFEARCGWAEQLAHPEAEKQAALYRQAVALYRADLLIDCYDDWCVVERERLQRLYVRALGRLMRYHQVRGEYDVAINDARCLLVCDPLREEVHRNLIRLYIDADQPAAALRQYRACEELMQRELGVLPMPETQALLKRLIRPPGAEPAASHPVTDAPRSTTNRTTLLSRRPTSAGDLPQASSLLNQACMHLRNAMVLLESAAARLQITLTSGSDASGPDDAPASEHVHQATLLVAEAAQQLAHVPSADSATPTIAAARRLSG